MSDETTRQPAGPCIVVIFGGTGDLTKRKLFPAFCNLARAGLMPARFALVGFGRSSLAQSAFQDRMAESLQDFAAGCSLAGECQRLVDGVEYFQGEYDDKTTYARLEKFLTDLSAKKKIAQNYLFYLSIPPELFGTVVTHLGNQGLLREEGDLWRRVIIEKPFGHDLASSRQLDATLRRSAEERQIYRIDHYLGKETVQNMLAFRFGNGIFETLWSNRFIDNVQITVAEDLGVEGRAGYYDTAGALRDMVPNHMLQLVAMLTMEPPVSLDGDAIRDEKTKLLRAVEIPTAANMARDVLRGQYAAGSINGNAVSAYTDEPNVRPGSKTETYVALKLKINNWRWAGVPFFLRTGKRLAARATTIIVEFKAPPYRIFTASCAKNLVRMNIQPNEGIALRIGAKVPGPNMRLSDVNLAFTYKDYFGTAPQTGYETLIYDCLIGDPTLFQRADAIDLGWQIVQPIIDAWRGSSPPLLCTYAAGKWGPKEADALIRQGNYYWHSVEDPLVPKRRAAREDTIGRVAPRPRPQEVSHEHL